MASNKIKLGFIGAGWQFRICLAPFFKENDQYEMTALVRNTGNAKEAAEEFGIKSVYRDCRKMYAEEDLDAVIISTPPFLHHPMAIEALNSGVHVFCEKPPAMNASQVKEMVEVAKKNKRLLYFGLNYRFMDNSIKLKEIVESGKLGDIYYGKTGWMNEYQQTRLAPGDSWKNKQECAGGGILIGQGVHTIDRVLWAMNYPKPVTVYGKVFNHFRKEISPNAVVEDLAVGFVNFENGFTMYLENSELINKPDVFYYSELFGTKGGVSVYRDKRATLYVRGEEDLSNTELVDNLDFDGEVICERQADYFAKSIEKNIVEPVQYKEMITLMKIIDGFYESARTNSIINIDYT